MTITRNIFRAAFWSLPKPIPQKYQAHRDPRYSSSHALRPYFDDSASIYIHIPKVAGKSIAMALYGEDPMHHHLRTFESLFPSQFQAYYKFGFVRNPWSRIFSTYHHIHKTEKHAPFGEWRWIRKYRTFENFVTRCLSSQMITDIRFLNTQASYLQNMAGVIGVDFVGKFENISSDFQHVSAIVAPGSSLGHIGKGASSDTYKNGYTTASRSMIGSLYGVDAHNFGYDFSGD